MPQRKGVENHTVGSGFILLGFADHSSLQGLCFPVFLLLCLVVLTGNSLIALTTAVDSSLHSPMCFFLRNLSFLEICYPSVTAKKAGISWENSEHKLSEGRSHLGGGAWPRRLHSAAHSEQYLLESAHQVPLASPTSKGRGQQGHGVKAAEAQVTLGRLAAPEA
ncbi:hypothetical protein QYF61_020463 [Mycteria americana]|uniref:Uncharacterized protein n=1 Tax=Mycteria americana TaxID=33587 RepID=A0AAN7MIT5_MYCAM|nr:hypothetical protein QYF61_020463 [Mycteria americana]